MAYNLNLYRGLFPVVYKSLNHIEQTIKYSTEFMIKTEIINSDSEFVLLNCLNADEMRVIQPKNMTPLMSESSKYFK